MPAPNLKYSSDPKYPSPPNQIRIGMRVYNLPDRDTQKRGFYHEDAEKIARTVKPYKLIQTKGKI